MVDLRAPFPWFGGKSRCAHLVWERFGNPPNYVEPFFGSGAVLLGRPHAPKTETVNDLDCLLANFWRALAADPAGVAFYADQPVNEADQHAKHLWLCSQAAFRERMKTEPDYFDVKLAGWWAWGQCVWIGGGWCEMQLAEASEDDKGARVHRQLLALGSGGRGVNRQSSDMDDAGERATFLEEYMGNLSARVRRVRVACGDWKRVLTPAVGEKHGITAVFLDPPYTDGNMQYAAGGVGGDLSREVFAWAIENGSNPELRIALCGYDGEHAVPAEWEEVEWKARKGYGSVENRKLERIWFSPHCLRPEQDSLFAKEMVDARV